MPQAAAPTVGRSRSSVSKSEREAAAFLAEAVRGRHAAALERDLAQRMRRGEHLRAGEAQARGVSAGTTKQEIPLAPAARSVEANTV